MSNWKVKALQEGKTIVSSEPGNSMTPILKSRQPVMLVPINKVISTDLWHLKDAVCCCEPESLVGDIVFCKVRGNYYTHLVKAYNPKRGFLIGNNHGHNNGWTWKIYGKVCQILPMGYKDPTEK